MSIVYCDLPFSIAFICSILTSSWTSKRFGPPNSKPRHSCSSLKLSWQLVSEGIPIADNSVYNPTPHTIGRFECRKPAIGIFGGRTPGRRLPRWWHRKIARLIFSINFSLPKSSLKAFIN